VVLIGAFAFLLVKGLSSAINFYLPVDQALHQKSTLGSQTFNLEGLVMPGSIQSTTRGVDFTLTAGGDSVRVVNTSAAVPEQHPGDRRRPLVGRHLPLEPDPGQAFGELHRRQPRAGDRPEREQAMTGRSVGSRSGSAR
jgi:hypothetical protein